MLVKGLLTISGTQKTLFYPILLKDTVLTVCVLSTNGVIILGYLTPGMVKKRLYVTVRINITPDKYLMVCVNDIIGHYGLNE